VSQKELSEVFSPMGMYVGKPRKEKKLPFNTGPKQRGRSAETRLVGGVRPEREGDGKPKNMGRTGKDWSGTEGGSQKIVEKGEVPQLFQRGMITTADESGKAYMGGGTVAEGPGGESVWGVV